MKKSDLKNGCVVELRNGDKYIKIDNTLINFCIEIYNEISCYRASLNDYNEDLTYKKVDEDEEWDIMKVNNNVMNKEAVCCDAIYQTFNFKKSIWTWEREENSERILTSEEYNYLKAVIEPVKDKIKYIIKYKINDKKEYIYIRCFNYNKIRLYEFDVDTQFKGVKYCRPYTLEELGLSQEVKEE